MKLVIRRTTIKDNVYYMFIMIIYLFVFQNALQDKIIALKYFDEFFAGCAVPVFLYRAAKKSTKSNIRERIIVGSILTTTLCGLISAVIHKYQSWGLVAMDSLLVLKFFLALYVGKTIFNRVMVEEKERNCALFHVKLLTVIFIIITICDYIFKIYPAQTRYNIRAVQLFYSHPSMMVASMVLIASLYIVTAQDKISLKWLIPILTMICLPLRTKGFGIAAAIILLYIIICKGQSQIKLRHILLGAAILWLVAQDQIEFYYGDKIDGIARAELQRTAFKIARDYFPLGTGFGTYASYASSVEYSPVYFLYGLNNVWGLSQQKNTFISDTFWPMIIGQFGWLGTIGYGSAIVAIWCSIQKIYKKNKYIYFSAIVAIIFLLISSTSESAFVNAFAPPLGLVIGMGLGSYDNLAIFDQMEK